MAGNEALPAEEIKPESDEKDKTLVKEVFHVHV